MTLEEIKAWLEAHKTESEVAAYLGELSAVSADKVKGFLETEEGKRLIQPRLDQHFTKGLETWKANNLEALINEEVAKRNPQKTPEQLEIEKLKKQIEDAENARKRETLVNQALKVAKEKNLPDGIIDFFIGADEESTTTNLAKFEEEYNKAIQAAVESKFKESGRTLPGTGGDGGADDFGKKLAKEYKENNEGLQEAQSQYFG